MDTISLYHLFWIIPAAIFAGMFLASLLGANNDHK